MTVGSTARDRAFQTFPIACGIFKKVIEAPGKHDDGVIPGPIAEVEEDQDRPLSETVENYGESENDITEEEGLDILRFEIY